MNFISRQLKNTVSSLLAKFPILALTGPRQSGKTTLLKETFPDYTYVTLENPDVRAFATEDPNGFLKTYGERIIFDGVQRAPQLFSYLQTVVDERAAMGQFILSGSQNFLFLEQITQSLAGRVALLTLLPLDQHELAATDLLPQRWQTLAIQGTYPAIYDRGLSPSEFYTNYLATYIERDVSQLLNLQDKRAFRNFLSLCAIRSGQLLNFSKLASESGVSHTTARRWLSLLESSYILFTLPPYFENFSKRITKSSKIYFYDTGLLAHLLEIRHEDEITNEETKGQLFENLVIAELIKQNHHEYLNQKFWFWRTSSGAEIDLLTTRARKFYLAEIKASSTVHQRFFKHLNTFSDLASDRVAAKTLFYGGSQDQLRTNARVLSWNSPERNARLL